MTPEARLAAMDLILPEVPKPLGNFVPFKIDGNTLYLSGEGPRHPDGSFITGKVGRDVSIEEAYGHARLVGMNLLAVLHEVLGDLGRVKRIVKLLGMVNAAPDFDGHPQVINGCSDLFIDICGPEAGSHARSAVGMGSLPGNITVEIEAIVAAHAP